MCNQKFKESEARVQLGLEFDWHLKTKAQFD